MILSMLQAKLHRACVTHSDIDYEGSCAIDSELLAIAGMMNYQQLHIYNVTNGERFTTYAISAESGSKIISINGAAAHKASPGDRIIICTYIECEEYQLAMHAPNLVYLDIDNDVIRQSNCIPIQKCS